MEPELKNLIKSPNLLNKHAVLHSDGLVFSVFLSHLFNHFAYQFNDEKAVLWMANELFNYFLCKKPLYHSQAKCFMFADKPITIRQVLTLLQNKYYELIGSEIERALFIRGGKDRADDLFKLTSVERINQVAQHYDKWYFFEKRNTLKHRSHFLSYKKLLLHFKHLSLLPADRYLVDQELASMAFRANEISGHDLWRLLYENRMLALEKSLYCH